MNIGIVGCGVVGLATAEAFKKHHTLFYYDKYKEGYGTLEELVKESEVIFITVSTPMKESGEIDLSSVRESVSSINSILFKDVIKENKVVVIRSSAVSGSTECLDDCIFTNITLAFNPEFLTDRNAAEDFKNSLRVIIGAEDIDVFNKIAKVYIDAGFTCPIIYTDIKTAEYIKYCSNIFLASQVAVANELYAIAQKCGVEWDKVVGALSYDKRIGSFMQVPGNDGDKGFGGKCFPKDLNAMIYMAREHGYRPYLLEEVWRTNLSVRNKIDW